ncbi:fibulin-1-like isoform X2 [Xenia sp. Carnegie-2017]|uniref:fibulin-1-like isoform X2 n=1 Tax=Xenia sp. Carnegie-2017 TaxID=2897299 RepID=UPI001F03BBFD|nr:fibulin-1-like isoform X2 [Xenia sp. Carnegie-2017]
MEIGRQGQAKYPNLPAMVCRMYAEMCCTKQLQKDYCKMGKEMAEKGGTCSGNNIKTCGKQHYKECCYCCYLGMKARKEKLQCTNSYLGIPCQQAFSSCCVSSEPHPTGTPKVFGVSLQEDGPTSPQSCSTLRCSQSCQVLRGIATCVCRNGFRLGEDGRTCVVNITCPRGLEMDPSGIQCRDIDECLKLPCRPDQECLNNRGSFECKSRCPSTYVYRNGRCERECRTGRLWNGRQCVDENECLRADSCRSNQRCVNTVGSYRCDCYAGYQNVGGSCVDINDCDRSPCGQGAVCENLPGGFRCDCLDGYERSGSNCTDIDECKRNYCRDNEICINKPGTYRCEQRKCPRGYRWKGTSCVDINECESKPCRSNEVCVNLPGRHRCIRVIQCEEGYERYRGRCRDKNECLNQDICRPPRPVCKNTPGSYRCEYKPCPRGFKRGRNGRCQDVNECTTGRHTCNLRAEECINTSGSFTCRCRRGYRRLRLDDRCRDIDECRSSNKYCAHKCINTQGSFRCTCRKGYTLVGRRNCYDINECNQQGGSRCQHNCINTQGSYLCRCNRGFQLQINGVHCSDINECSSPRRYGACAYQCKNSPGSFKCSCPNGYESLYSGRYCRDIDECSLRNPCRSDGACINTKGGYECLYTTCPNGFFIKRSTTQCTRRYCRYNERNCWAEKRKSIRWHGRAFPLNAKRGAFTYFYNITTTGYARRPSIEFNLKKGNDHGTFQILSLGYGKAKVINRKVFDSPRAYKLKFVGEVISGRSVTAKFITYLHIYVSQYDF